MNARRNSPTGLLAAADHVALEAWRQGLDLAACSMTATHVGIDAVLLLAMWPSGECITGYALHGMDDVRDVMEASLQ